MRPVEGKISAFATACRVPLSFTFFERRTLSIEALRAGRIGAASAAAEAVKPQSTAMAEWFVSCA